MATTKKLIRTLLVLILIVSPFLVSNSKAAGMGMGPGGGDPPPTPCGGPFPPCPIPLNDGVIFLLMVGAIYGGKKIYDSAKRNPA